MHKLKMPYITVVDYGMGNLFSIQQAFIHLGARVEITSERKKILNADMVVLPGVGAFADAMNMLKRLDLISVLQDLAGLSIPLIGICLGMQLLLSRGYEFGNHKGLDLIPGEVVPLSKSQRKLLKVPHVGWNRIYKPESLALVGWENTPLQNIEENEFMYFVHSFYAVPEKRDVCLSMTRYGEFEFCSSLQYKNIFGCQFHPERSGKQGLYLYRNLLRNITSIPTWDGSAFGVLPHSGVSGETTGVPFNI